MTFLSLRDIAEGTGLSPEQSLVGTVIAGMVSVMVAFIGYLGLKIRGRSNAVPPASPEEPQWVKDLRWDKSRLLRERDDRDIVIRGLEFRIEFLERLVIKLGGNPFPREVEDAEPPG